MYGYDSSEPKVAVFEVEAIPNFQKTFLSGMYYLINFIDTEILRIELAND